MFSRIVRNKPFVFKFTFLRTGFSMSFGIHACMNIKNNTYIRDFEFDF